MPWPPPICIPPPPKPPPPPICRPPPNPPPPPRPPPPPPPKPPPPPPPPRPWAKAPVSGRETTTAARKAAVQQNREAMRMAFQMKCVERHTRTGSPVRQAERTDGHSADERPAGWGGPSRRISPPKDRTEFCGRFSTAFCGIIPDLCDFSPIRPTAATRRPPAVRYDLPLHLCRSVGSGIIGQRLKWEHMARFSGFPPDRAAPACSLTRDRS